MRQRIPSIRSSAYSFRLKATKPTSGQSRTVRKTSSKAEKYEGSNGFLPESRFYFLKQFCDLAFDLISNPTDFSC